MADSGSQFPALLGVVADLEAAGFSPVLVGGMALVMMGSQRLTRDFDLVIPDSAATRDQLIRSLYKRGLELVTKFSSAREVIRTVDNVNVAVIKLKLQNVRTIPFYSWKEKLQIDLMLDFPLPAAELAGRSVRVTTASGTVRIAAPEDLLRMKEMAFGDRKSGRDAQDIEFLRRHERKK